MTQITASAVASLRSKTGAGMMDCKKALSEAGGDEARAAELLRKKGLQTADKKADRTTGEGRVYSYIHHNQKVGVMIEVACETDFVARNENFEALLKDLCMHVAAVHPTPLAIEKADVPADLVEKERRLISEADDLQGKPEEIKEKILAGKLDKFLAERALLEQEFVKDPDMKVGELIKSTIGKLGENIKINRFARFELGG